MAINEIRNIAIGLGSNLGARLENLRSAVEHLETNNINIIRKSDVFETEPWGVTDQPAFLNACVMAESSAPLLSILTTIKKIEEEMGRKKNIRWGARLIDIDILFVEFVGLSGVVGETIYESAELTVPHKEMLNRAFVLHPLAQICPEWRHPIAQVNIAEAAAKFPVPHRIVTL